MKEFQISSSDGLMLKGKHWVGKEKPRAVIQIVHGMVEHIGRYDSFARILVDNGFEVYGHSHRGHGKTAKNREDLGYFANTNGWDLLVEDVAEVTSFIKENAPELPVIILGHSMGSFVVRDLLRRHPNDYDGAILVGSGWEPKMKLLVAKLISKTIRQVSGAKKRSNVMNFVLFGHYNNRIKNTRTAFDWLSRDHEMVKAYVEDPYCGFICTAGFYDDLLTGAMRVMTKRGDKRIPKWFPLLILSGDEDPVGQYSKGVKKLKQNYIESGLEEVTLKLFPKGRHEILNEINRMTVYDEICGWVDKVPLKVHSKG
jgi:alpha-beta hydrolase superfamily lysophospholipase